MSDEANDLDHFLDIVTRKIDANFRIHEAASKQAARSEERARQDFLQGFQDISEHIIRPAFERAHRSTEALTIESEYSCDFIELKITMRTGDKNPSTIWGFLRYRAVLDKKCIMREGYVSCLPNRSSTFSVNSIDLTPDQVKREIFSLVKDAQTALQDKRI